VRSERPSDQCFRRPDVCLPEVGAAHSGPRALYLGHRGAPSTASSPLRCPGFWPGHAATGSRTSGSILRRRPGPWCGDAVDLQPVGVAQGDQPAAVAERDRRPDDESGPRLPTARPRRPAPAAASRDQGSTSQPVDVPRAGVDHGDGLSFGCRVDRVDQRGDDADGVIGAPLVRLVRDQRSRVRSGRGCGMPGTGTPGRPTPAAGSGSGATGRRPAKPVVTANGWRLR
jgi:hypothetical protein